MSTSGAVESFTKTTFAPPQPDYVPAAGDVVTFKYDGKTVTGIVFMHDWGYLCIVKKDHGSDVMIKEHEFPTLRKFGSCDKMGSSPMSYSKAHRIAKSYFSIPHPYVPAVGDVVEFEYCGEMLKALVYESKMYELCTIDNTDRCKDGYHRKIKDYTFNYRKVGEVDVSGINHWDKARKIAKAYFSKPTFTGTYAERQKQAIEHYGWKVDSKVVLTRKAEDDEWEFLWVGDELDPLIGTEVEIRHISERHLQIGSGIQGYVPYFVLEPA